MSPFFLGDDVSVATLASSTVSDKEMRVGGPNTVLTKLGDDELQGAPFWATAAALILKSPITLPAPSAATTDELSIVCGDHTMWARDADSAFDDLLIEMFGCFWANMGWLIKNLVFTV